MANSTKRLQSNIAKNIREILSFDLNMEKLDFFTVTSVDVTEDHSYCRIYVSFFTNPHQNLERLNKVKGFVRSQLSKRLKTRRTPELEFILDEGYLREERLTKILNKEKEDIDEMKK